MPLESFKSFDGLRAVKTLLGLQHLHEGMQLVQVRNLIVESRRIDADKSQTQSANHHESGSEQMVFFEEHLLFGGQLTLTPPYSDEKLEKKSPVSRSGKSTRRVFKEVRLSDQILPEFLVALFSDTYLGRLLMESIGAGMTFKRVSWSDCRTSNTGARSQRSATFYSCSVNCRTRRLRLSN